MTTGEYVSVSSLSKTEDASLSQEKDEKRFSGRNV
jgi:hypothetical protein